MRSPRITCGGFVIIEQLLSFHSAAYLGILITLYTTPMLITESQAYDRLKKVIDPELSVDIVGLGLVYDVTVREVQREDATHTFVHVLMTLTTPGCPLAGVFGQMVKDQFIDIPGFDPQKDMEVELTFDPPWIPDMMTEEARAELGL